MPVMYHYSVSLGFRSCLIFFLLTLLINFTKGSHVTFMDSCKKRFWSDQDCFFKVSENWDFRDFRKWLNNIDVLGDVDLTITCIQGGSVYIPWPFRARNLRKVRLNNCYLKGFYNELNVQSQYTDTLRERVIVNNVIEVSVPDWFDSVINTKPEKSYTCGQELLEMDISRNNTLRLINNPMISINDSMSMLLEAYSKTREDLKSQPFECHYNNLVYLEKSFVKSLGRSFMEEMTLHSFYPKLLALNLSSNPIWHLPEELQRWVEKFPQLEYLDLSNCKLQSFSFAKPTPHGREKAIYINMQNNNISEVPTEFSRYSTWSPPILIDLYGNPIP